MVRLSIKTMAKKRSVFKDKKEKWYRLDSSADLYTMSLSRVTQSNFRATVEMQKKVDPIILQQALELTYTRYPSFKVHLRKGLFRFYFEENNNKPVVFPCSGIFMENMDFRKNKRFVIRVSYYENDIVVDYFHGLTDGTGAVEFLKTLLYSYLKLSGEKILNTTNIKVPETDFDPEEEMEDATAKYFKDFPLNDKAVGSMTGKNSIYLKDKPLVRPGFGVIRGYVDASKIKGLAKKYDCSITEYFAALALMSINSTFVKDGDKKNLAIMIPVNLRNIFPSKTLHNFTTLVRCELDQHKVEPDMQAYVDVIKEDLRKGVEDHELLNKKLSIAALMAKKIYLRLMPSLFKMIFIKVPKTPIVRPRQSLILSNLGIFKVSDDVGRHIKCVGFNVNVSSKTPINVGVMTHNGVACISFTSRIASTEFEREFFTRLVKEGVDVKISSNNRIEADKQERSRKGRLNIKKEFLKEKRKQLIEKKNALKAK